MMRPLFTAALISTVLVCSAGPVGAQDAPAIAPAAGSQGDATSAPAAISDPKGDYRLGPGDKVRLTVFGEANLTGEYYVSGAGALSIPLIGDIDAKGRTVSELLATIRTRLADGYIRDPKVAAEVLTYRPFYILGEVSKPGEYPYTSDLTVMNAAAKAGGFTYYAQKRFVYIRHAGASKETKVRVNATTPVEPGDTIRVAEAWF